MYIQDNWMLFLTDTKCDDIEYEGSTLHFTWKILRGKKKEENGDAFFRQCVIPEP